jgi:Cys-rich four helix bundle protein (predicted Tat secretion target)
MDRRAFLGSAVMLGAGLAAGVAKAEGAAGKGTAGLLVTNVTTLGLIAKLRDAAYRCDQKAATCEQHCTERLSAGDADFGRCSLTVQQMQAVCAATGKLAAMKSVQLAGMLDACTAACRTCKEACEEHKAHWAHGMHMECKECAEACDAVIAAVAAVKAGWKVS